MGDGRTASKEKKNINSIIAQIIIAFNAYLIPLLNITIVLNTRALILIHVDEYMYQPTA